LELIEEPINTIHKQVKALEHCKGLFVTIYYLDADFVFKECFAEHYKFARKRPIRDNKKQMVL